MMGTAKMEDRFFFQWYGDHREKGRGLWASPTVERLSELGGQGWELVAVDALNGRFYFKRPKP